MISISSSSEIRRIEVFSQWIGFAAPSASAKLTITNRGGQFVRQQARASTSDAVPERVISKILTTLARPPVPELDVTLFDAPAEDVERHHNCCWTNDHPSLLIRIVCDGERLITVRTHAQYTFMLPLKVSDSATGVSYETFDPRLSRALSGLMPEEFLGQARLAGDPTIFELERKAEESFEQHRREREMADADEARRKAAGQPAAGSQPAAEARREFRGFFHPQSLSLDVLRQRLAEGANPSLADENGQTALMHAAFPPFHREVFRALVEAGADLEARRCDGLTGLHLACSGGEADAVEEWVRAGACISARTPEGATPLMLGATSPRIVRTLLDAHAENNLLDDDGHHALMYNVLQQSLVGARGQLKALQLLLSAGIDVNLADREGILPLTHARKVLAEAELAEEVMLELNPERTVPQYKGWTDRQLADRVIALLVEAGARE